MTIMETASNIASKKLAFMELVRDKGNAASSEAAAFAADKRWSSDAIEKNTREVRSKYEEWRAAAAAEATAELLSLYDRAANECAEVFARKPSAGESAYLDAFLRKPHRTKSDYAQAILALKGNVSAIATVNDYAGVDGISMEELPKECRVFAPSYISLLESRDRCKDAIAEGFKVFGVLDGSNTHPRFANGLRMELYAKNIQGDEFEQRIIIVSDFE